MNPFFDWVRKNIIWITIIILASAILGAFLISRNNKLSPGAPLGYESSPSPLASHFKPYFLSGSSVPQKTLPSYLSGSFVPPKTLQDLAKILPSLAPSLSSASSQSSLNELLVLPDVLNGELNISSTGAGNARGYLENIAAAFKSAPYTNATDLMKDGDGFPFFPPELIVKALSGGDKSEIKKSLMLWNNFNDGFLGEYESVAIKNSANVLNLAKMVVGYVKLYKELINKGLKFVGGQLGAVETQTYYDKFIKTRDFYSNKIKLMTGGLVKINKGNFLAKIVSAQESLLPYGGINTEIMYCCNGLWYIIKPALPSPPGPFLATWAFLASPFFYEFKIIHPGSWDLGTYTPGGTCQTGTYCSTSIAVVGTLYPGNITGTSY